MRTSAERPERGPVRRARACGLAAALVLALALPTFAAAPAAAATRGARIATSATADAPSTMLRPHTVVYRVSFKGMAAGDLELRLTRENGTLWRYETRPQPSFLARMVVSAASRERGTFRLGPDGVTPVSYSLDDGSAQRTRDEAAFEYDRAAGRVRGYARGEPLELPIVPGLQDPLSIRAAILVDLLAGRELGEYPMIDGRQVRTYVYRRVGTEKIATALGELEAVVYTSSRKDADARAKTWKYWYAPSLGWLPVRIEQHDPDGVRLAFAVRSAELQ
jgi:hypothetical protein